MADSFAYLRKVHDTRVAGVPLRQLKYWVPPMTLALGTIVRRAGAGGHVAHLEAARPIITYMSQGIDELLEIIRLSSLDPLGGALMLIQHWVAFYGEDYSSLIQQSLTDAAWVEGLSDDERALISPEIYNRLSYAVIGEFMVNNVFDIGPFNTAVVQSSYSKDLLAAAYPIWLCWHHFGSMLPDVGVFVQQVLLRGLVHREICSRWRVATTTVSSESRRPSFSLTRRANKKLLDALLAMLKIDTTKVPSILNQRMSDILINEEAGAMVVLRSIIDQLLVIANPQAYAVHYITDHASQLAKIEGVKYPSAWFGSLVGVVSLMQLNEQVAQNATVH